MQLTMWEVTKLHIIGLRSGFFDTHTRFLLFPLSLNSELHWWWLTSPRANNYWVKGGWWQTTTNVADCWQHRIFIFLEKMTFKANLFLQSFRGKSRMAWKKWMSNKSWKKYPESGELYLSFASGHYFQFIVRNMFLIWRNIWQLNSLSGRLPSWRAAGTNVHNPLTLDHPYHHHPQHHPPRHHHHRRHDHRQGNNISHHYTWWWWWWSISLISVQTRSSTSLPSS